MHKDFFFFHLKIRTELLVYLSNTRNLGVFVHYVDTHVLFLFSEVFTSEKLMVTTHLVADHKPQTNSHDWDVSITTKEYFPCHLFSCSFSEDRNELFLISRSFKHLNITQIAERFNWLKIY